MHKFSFWDYDMAGRSRNRLAFFLSLFFLLFFSACKPSPELLTPSTETSYRGFYHWQTEFSLDSVELRWLDELAADRIFVKFFDLDWDPPSANVVPLASVQLDTTGLGARQIIPTIFITNRSMLQLAEEEIPLLAQRITEKIDREFTRLDQTLQELQLDCDWTARSRLKYFDLLEQLAQLYEGRNVRLSVTIRLHQLRYPERTGVPPVDRGVLMFYNMGDLQNWAEPNSILNLKKAAAYLPDGLSYPIPLDLALPLFRWAVLFREGKMIKLINEPKDSLLRDEHKFEAIAPGRFTVLENTYLNGYYLYRGDQLRIESVSMSQLRSAYELLKKQYPEVTQSLIFYHLDGAVLDRYNLDSLRNLR